METGLLRGLFAPVALCSAKLLVENRGTESFDSVILSVCEEVGIATFSLTEPSQASSLADFFLKHGVAVMTVRELFEFVTDPSITSENMDAYLSKVRRGRGWEDRKQWWWWRFCVTSEDSGFSIIFVHHDSFQRPFPSDFTDEGSNRSKKPVVKPGFWVMDVCSVG